MHIFKVKYVVMSAFLQGHTRSYIVQLLWWSYVFLPETDANEQEDLGKALSAVKVRMHFIIAM